MVVARVREFPGARHLARALLLFWAIWFSVVASSNAVDALREAGVVPATWRFTSGNFSLVADALSFYSVPRTGAAVLFSLVLLAQMQASALFWRAALQSSPPRAGTHPRILAPFLVAIGLFCAFLVFDEALLVYLRFPNLETAHFAILGALLLSLLVIHALDGRDPTA